MRDRGAHAEQCAADHLLQHGLQLVVRNYHCRYGEIDLVMREHATLVFVEVRQRSRIDFGGAAASIDAHKQRKLILTAQHYLAQQPHTPPCRFDVVLIGPDGMEWIKNAFCAW